MLSSFTLPGTDLAVSRMCLGGNVFGWTAGEAESFAVLDTYLEAGGNFVDTADVYSQWHPGNSGGESERIIGRWLRSRGAEASGVVVATKGGGLAPERGLSRRAVTRAIEASLRRLGTSHIDLWYAHFDDPETAPDETMAALDLAVRDGKVRYVGASNFSAPRLEQSLRAASRARSAPYRCLQVHLNLLERDGFPDPLRTVTERHGVAVLAYYALAAGVLTGKYDAGNSVDTGRGDRARRLLDRPGAAGVLTAQRVVAERHAVPMASVAVAWLLAQPGVAGAIASARRPSQIEALVTGAQLVLGPDELAALA